MKIKLLVGFFALATLMGCSDEVTLEDTTSEELVEVEAEEELVENVEEDSSEEKIHAISTDIKDGEAFSAYLDQLRPILLENLEILNYVEEIKQYAANGEILDEEFLEIMYSDIIPSNTELQLELENIQVEIPEIRSAHEKIILFMSKNTEIYSEMVAFVETGDSSKFNSANSLATESRQIEREANYELQELAEKYGVSLQ